MSQSPRHPVPPLLQSQKRKGIPLPLLPPLPLHRTATHQEQWAGPAWLLGPSVPRSQLVAPPASVCTHLATAGPKAGLARGQGWCLGTHHQERQDKHRDPGRTDRAAAAQTPASLRAGASGSPRLLPQMSYGTL